MLFNYIKLFIIGGIELFLGTIDFKLTQKNRKVFSSISTYFLVLIWYLIIRTIIENIDNFYLVNIYATGCALGCYLGLKLEPFIEKHLKLNPRGRKLRKGKRRKKKR